MPCLPAAHDSHVAGSEDGYGSIHRPIRPDFWPVVSAPALEGSLQALNRRTTDEPAPPPSRCAVLDPRLSVPTPALPRQLDRAV